MTEWLQEGEHFLGKFSQESAAARACDVAALKLHGASATTNFPVRSESTGGPTLLIDCLVLYV